MRLLCKNDDEVVAVLKNIEVEGERPSALGVIEFAITELSYFEMITPDMMKDLDDQIARLRGIQVILAQNRILHETKAKKAPKKKAKSNRK